MSRRQPRARESAAPASRARARRRRWAALALGAAALGALAYGLVRADEPEDAARPEATRQGRSAPERDAMQEGGRWLRLDGTAALRAAPCPSPTAIEPAPISRRELAAARAGRFQVFGRRPTRLVPPVDWTANPLGANRYRQNLEKLRFLSPLLQAYAQRGDVAALRQASRLALDWARGNVRFAPTTLNDAWKDKVVGDRVPYLSYTLRAAACEDLVDREQAGELLAALREHGRYLTDPSRYTADNHGLFVDLGLLRLSRFLPFLDQAGAWERRARDRFLSTLRGRLAGGVWLEHSSNYQFLAIRPVDDFVRVYGPDPKLERLLARMGDAAGWFVRPDGRISQLGDSDLLRAPEWASPDVTGQSGLRVFEGAGFAFVRAAGPDEQPGYLAFTAGFHNLTHKHADELSFELYDRGRPIVADTGLYNKDPGRARQFVLSARAHSTLTVDGRSFPIADPAGAYGSAIRATGEGDGWYAIEGTNPLLRPQGVHHERLLLYSPGRALVVVDRVRSATPHTYTRYVQLAPGLRIAGRRAPSLELRAAGFTAHLHDAPARAPARRSAVRGRHRPLAGLTAPAFREWRPRWTLAYADRAASETRALTLALDEEDLRARSVRASGRKLELELAAASGERSSLRVRGDGRHLVVEELPAAGDG